MLTPKNVAVAAIAGFVALEFVLRRGGSARSWRSSGSDRGTTLLLATAYLVAGVAFSLRSPDGALPVAARWAGAALAFAGLGLRIAAFRALGASYSRTLRVNEDQKLVTSGMYRVIRHPGYLSSLILWSGAVLATGSLIGVGVVLAALLGAYIRRIRVEEAMLLSSFGESYRTYQNTSWKLVPYIY